MTDIEIIAKIENQIGKKFDFLMENNSVTYIRINDTNLEDLTLIGQLHNLVELNLKRNRIRDLLPLIRLKKLLKLNINRNIIKDISPLQELNQLEKLDMGGPYVNDISPLRFLKKLSILYISNNPVTDISPLQELKQLIRLDLRNIAVVVFPEWITEFPNMDIIWNEDYSLDDCMMLYNTSIFVPPIETIKHGKHAMKVWFQQNKNNFPEKVFINQKDKEIIIQLHAKTCLEPIYKTDVTGNVISLSLNHANLDDISLIIKFNELQELNLRNNKIKDLSLLSILVNLTELDLSYNEIVDLSSLKYLKNLTKLLLNENKISDISPLNDLKMLTVLRLRKNYISDLNPLQDKFHLTILDLDKNNISDINSLKNLSELNELHLETNHITDIFPIIMLIKLQFLNIQENVVSDISAVANLKELNSFWAEINQIEDITPLKSLNQLKFLILRKNQIKDITPLKELKQLIFLSLESNPIINLPEWIIEFPNLNVQWKSERKNNYISFYDNPIENIPIEIIAQGKNAVRNYFAQLKEEKERKYLFEAKLLIIGEGGVGKTTFARKIQNAQAQMPDGDDTTFGIDVSKWNFTVQHHKLGEKIMFTNIWDFGGQNLYKGTHQMFFSTKSFYVLINDSREEKTDFAYWINTVEQLVKSGSKILIITNIKHSLTTQIDKNLLLGHFGDLIAGFVEIDLKNDFENIVKLQDTVKNYLKNLPEIGSPLPASWVNIREDLFRENRNFISYDRFIEICKRHNTYIENINFLSEYFNRIGVFMHYYEDDLLHERVYLNSNWLVQMVYKILNHQIVKDKKGRLESEDIKAIWKDNELFNENDKLTRLMHRFGLMYKIPDRNEFVVPVHLNSEQPYKKWQYDSNGEVLQFVYEFDRYMPKGIMSRLIVALHRYVTNHELVWQKGVNITYNATYAEICEICDRSNKYVIRLFGSEKKELLGIINSKFDEILSPFQNLHYKKLVPCTCKECNSSNQLHFYEYSDLLRRKERGIFQIQCSNSYTLLDVIQLIDGIELVKTSNTVDTFNEGELKEIKKILMLFIEKKYFLEKELITTYDSEKKFALLEEIKKLDKQINDLKIESK
jgi:Leucine-rich repeat (LRR) protein